MLVFFCLALPLYREIDYGYSNNVEATLCTGNCSGGKCIYFIMHGFIFFCIDHYGYLKRSIYKAKIAQCVILNHIFLVPHIRSTVS